MSPSKRLSEETKFTQIADHMDFNVEEYECSECKETFIWGDSEQPKYCPKCGRKRADA
jgi:rubrerythrin